MQEFDYIIVGAGSAGATLAYRLSEDGKYKVAILEYGGRDDSIFIQMPTALSIPMTMNKYNWGYWSEPEPGLDNRRLDCPRGKVWGGSSSINGMVYVRGHGEDFAEWEQLGAKNWGYAHNLPYFKRAETWFKKDDNYRGNNGQLGTNNGNNMTRSPLYNAFIDAGAQCGYPVTDDYNGYQQEGFGPMHMSVKNGRRSSTSLVYLKPALKRPNVYFEDKAMVSHIVFEGKKATQIAYYKGKDRQKLHYLKANKEIILSAGSINSPVILQQSGIGNANHLQALGIDVVHDLPGVGENLQDHLEVYFQYKCKQNITLNGKLNPISKFLIGLEWVLFKTGLGATNHFEACAFIRSDKGVKFPDIQYHFLPAAMRYDGRSAFAGHGYQVHVGANKPTSRGSVRIKSRNIDTHPAILFNYLTTDKDIQDWRKVIRLTREILNAKAFDAYRGQEIQPGENIISDDAIDAWVRAHVESAYHPSCTCKIGADGDKMAVLDSECKVRGVDNLRVVDSSIFPTITNGNLNSPTIMVAEKAADIILEKAPLSPSNAPYWLHPNWQDTQR